MRISYPFPAAIMRETTVAMPVIALVAATRGMLGAGVALLLGDRLSKEQRRAVGWISSWSGW